MAPVGCVMPFLGIIEPEGWALAYGQAVPRTGTYANLFAIIGTTYGAGDGSTTFNLPDLRGRVIAGRDNMGGTAANRLTTGGSGVNGAALGGNGGAETHTLSTAQMPVHSHGTNDPGHTHAFNNGYAAYTNQTTQTWGGGSAGGITASGLAPNVTGITIQNAGSGQAHNNTQPTYVLNFIIKY